MSMFSPQSQWIWLSGDTAYDTYADFRKAFVLDEPVSAKATLVVSCDSHCDIFVNGTRLHARQYGDIPPERSCSQLDVAPLLHAGENLIAVRVHYIGRRFFTYCPNKPGLIAELTVDGVVRTATDASWTCSLDAAYVSGRAELVTSQLDFTFEYDSIKENSWFMPGFDDTDWANATEVPNDFVYIPRPAVQLEWLAAPPVAIVQCGKLLRRGEGNTPAEQCSRDLLQATWNLNSFFPTHPQFRTRTSCDAKLHLGEDSLYRFIKPAEDSGFNGVYAIFDLGEEVTGYLELDIDCDGCACIDVAHGEHLDDGHVRASIGQRNFCDRFHASPGRNRFTHSLRRIGARYIELHITDMEGDLTIHYAGLTPTMLPLPESVPFSCGDSWFEKLLTTGENTMRLCMHEHYEDCPWREQSLYPGDSRNQMLYGYYVWGNYAFARSNLELMGKTYPGNGQLTIVAPAMGAEHMTIPSFTTQWFVSMHDYFLHSGDSSLYDQFHDTIQDILKQAIGRKDEATGLYKIDEREFNWYFYEWSTNMNRVNAPIQAAWNLNLYEALVNTADAYWHLNKSDLAEMYESVAKDLAQAIETNFYDSADGGYLLTPDAAGKPKNEYIQNFMGAMNLVPKDKLERFLTVYDEPDLIHSELSSMLYYMRNALNAGPETRAALVSHFRAIFEPMLLTGNNTLWETTFGADDFTFAGSLCHGWSALPSYYARAILLGASPLEPAFKRCLVKPYPATFTQCSGDIPTPHGPIHISWKLTDDGRIDLDVKAPAEVDIVLEAYPEYPLLQK